MDLHGSLPVKYEGKLEMYYLYRLKSEYAADDRGIVPNHTFKVKYLLRQFTDLQEIILDKLERELPSYLYYHNYKHTIDVINQAELIGFGVKGWLPGGRDILVIGKEPAGGWFPLDWPGNTIYWVYWKIPWNYLRVGPGIRPKGLFWLNFIYYLDWNPN